MINEFENTLAYNAEKMDAHTLAALHNYYYGRPSDVDCVLLSTATIIKSFV